MSETETASQKQLGAVVAVFAVAGATIMIAGHAAQTWAYEVIGQAMQFAGAMLFLAGAPVLAELTSTLSWKWQRVVIGLFGAVLAGTLGVAYIHSPALFADLAPFVGMFAGVLGAAVLVAIATALYDRWVVA